MKDVCWYRHPQIIYKYERISSASPHIYIHTGISDFQKGYTTHWMVIVIAGCGGVGAKMAEEKHQNALHQISQSREQYFACNFHFKVILVKVKNNI